jgi:hypothetical protein
MRKATLARLGPQLWVAMAFLLLLATPLSAKTQVDFDPEINFEQFKTFAYLGGINKLMMQQLNPDLLSEPGAPLGDAGAHCEGFTRSKTGRASGSGGALLSDQLEGRRYHVVHEFWCL